MILTTTTKKKYKLYSLDNKEKVHSWYGKPFYFNGTTDIGFWKILNVPKIPEKVWRIVTFGWKVSRLGQIDIRQLFPLRI